MQTKEQIQARVTANVAEMLGIDPTTVTPDSGFVANLGADSLDLIELTMALEDEFNIEISDADAEKLTNVQQATEFILERLQQKG